jgi:integrase/recombinase XerD
MKTLALHTETALVPNTSSALANAGTEYVDATDARLVAMFLDGRKENTVKKYTRDLESLFRFLDGRSYRSVGLDVLQDWKRSLSGAAKSVHERVATVRSFYAWSVKIGALRLNPAATLKNETVRERLEERVLSTEERERIIGAAKAERDYAVLQFLFASGCRVSELCDLRAKDLRFKADGSVVVSIYRTKTEQTTSQTYSPASGVPALLRTLVDGRDAESFVFRSNGVPSRIKSRAGANADGRLDTTSVWRIVRAAAKRAGIAKRVSPHWFRHSCATHLVETGKLTDVAQWLGHKNIQTTVRYIHVVGSLNMSTHLPTVPAFAR